MNEKTIMFMKQSFKEFYFKNAEKIIAPFRLKEREFGYVPFNKVMIRHLSFQNEGNLRVFLIKKIPRSVYYSCAYYNEPTLVMNEKGWKGSDLIFDIDADDIPTQCKEEHDHWICKDCNAVGKGKRPNNCPMCGGLRIDKEKWVCQYCLEATKDEVIKLIDFLLEDFGISKEKINIHFSGHRGYHVTVENIDLVGLDQLARSEISDYVSGIGLSLESLGISKKASSEKMYHILPQTNELSWRGRIAKFFSEMELKGYNNKDIKDKIILIYEKKRHKKFENLIKEIVRKLNAKIDTMVTTDIHRIFRLPNTLHGSTGMPKKRCKDLLSFNPLIDAVVLSEEPIQIFVDHSPKFFLKGNTFGPFKSEKAKLPSMVAVYLIGKGLAEVS